MLRWADIARFVIWFCAGSSYALIATFVGFAIQALTFVALVLFWR